MKYALIRNNIVENVIVWNGDTNVWAPSADVVAVECPENVGVGWRYSNSGFLTPTVDVVQPRLTNLTANDFLDLFTITEQAAFEISLETVKSLIASGGTPSPTQSALLVVNRRLSSTDLISLSDPRISASLDILVSAGILEFERKAIILAGNLP